MASHRSSHRRASRLAFAVLAAVAVVAGGVVVVKSFGAEHAASGPLQAHQEGPTLADAGVKTPATAIVSGQIEQANVVRTLDSSSTTRPSNSTTRPAFTGDAAATMHQAELRRDAGDLVTARNLVNEIIVGAPNYATDPQYDAAKQFCASLNDKIVFGTMKFPADTYNKDWKVEPGTALWKLAKRFDVTAELLCRVNGLSNPSKLKAGVTIKCIQGPFFLVVSKSKFTADIYLGAPGGEGSTYVKTLHVGLGSDNSTPTGLWQIDTGKVMNPVYYSARGEGVIAADDPANPLGERWIPLKGIEGDCVGKESYGIHGTIDPNSIGKNMSQGCIRLLSDDINLLYDLLVEQKSQVRVVD